MKAYVIEKDGLYLANYRYDGLQYYKSMDKIVKVPTCIWSSSKRDARVIKTYLFALSLASDCDAKVATVDIADEPQEEDWTDK